MVFAMARKVRKYAVEMDDFVTENLLNLSFDSTDLQFKTLYEKLVKFLRNREIMGVSSKTGVGDQKDPAVFNTQAFQMELNRALQRRENNRRQKDFKKKKIFEKNQNRNQDFQKNSRGGPPNRKVWFCTIHGKQTDHSSEWCTTFNQNCYRRRRSFKQRQIKTLYIVLKRRSQRQKPTSLYYRNPMRKR